MSKLNGSKIEYFCEILTTIFQNWQFINAKFAINVSSVYFYVYCFQTKPNYKLCNERWKMCDLNNNKKKSKRPTAISASRSVWIAATNTTRGK